MLNIAQRHYWRSFSFDVYTGSGWVSSKVERIETPADQPLYDIPAGYQLLRQSFELKHGDEGSLYWSGVLYRSNLPFEGAWRIKPGEAFPQVVDPFRGADLYGALNTSAVYSVESLVPQVSEERLRAAGRDIPDFIQQRYTSLPKSVPERVYALARDLTSTQPTSFDEARALESYLRENYPYTLDVPTPPLGVDVADYFLFDLKKGYCDYYATAMAVMARAVGLPARLVMGYASGTYNPQTAEYIVSAADAHAWVEIYFPGTGWVEFEPTAGLPAIHRPIQGVTASVAESPVVPVWERIVRRVYGMPVLLRWIVFSLAGLLGMMVLFLFLESWLLGFASPIFALRWMYRSLYRQAAHLAGVPSPGQTASEFSEGLQSTFKRPDNHLSLLTSLYLQAIFSPNGLNKSELTRAIRAWRNLRWKLLFTRNKKKTST
jgi:transglutaminase-like putative cysteine protease